MRQVASTQVVVQVQARSCQDTEGRFTARYWKAQQDTDIARYYLARYYLAVHYSGGGGGGGALFLDFFLKKVPVILFRSKDFFFVVISGDGSGGVFSFSGEGAGLSGEGLSAVVCLLLAARSHHNFINLKFLADNTSIWLYDWKIISWRVFQKYLLNLHSRYLQQQY